MDEPEQTISVVLPVHAGVRSEHLEAALDSVLAQTRQADEIVIVEDGPLPGAHLAVLDGVERRHPAVLRIALPENQGAGVANQAGLEPATGTWIAKVDADDVSLPTRFEVQLQALSRLGADVCGGFMLEFDDAEERPAALRKAPLDHGSIAHRMRFNNPINHPTSMYRRDLAIASGGYPDFRFMQDYVLFARMLNSGARMVNIDQVLVHFRSGRELPGRRRHRDYWSLEWRLQRELRALGLISRSRMIANVVVRLAYRRVPTPIMRWVNRRVLASPVGSDPQSPRKVDS